MFYERKQTCDVATHIKILKYSNNVKKRDLGRTLMTIDPLNKENSHYLSLEEN